MSFASEFALGEFITSAGVIAGDRGFQAEGQSTLSFAGSFTVPGRFDVASINILVFDSYREVYSTYSVQSASGAAFAGDTDPGGPFLAETDFNAEGDSTGEFLSFWSYRASTQIQGDTQLQFQSGIEKPTDFGINSGTTATFGGRWTYLADFAAEGATDITWNTAAGFASRFSAQGASAFNAVSSAGVRMAEFRIVGSSTFDGEVMPLAYPAAIVVSRPPELRHVIRPRETRTTAWRPE
jgi:hypothetical protein